MDAALLDMNLGTETSMPVAHLLQARSIPFAFLTGHATKQALSVFSAAPLLSKPVMPKELLAVLEELLPARFLLTGNLWRRNTGNDRHFTAYVGRLG